MIFGKQIEYWKDKQGYWTADEIREQPKTWNATIEQIRNRKEEIQSFIRNVTDQEDYDIILAGAGTSEYAGDSLFSYLNKVTNYKCKSYATTDLVAAPENYLSLQKATLLVSFGRSGDSPESVGAVEAANRVCKDNIWHLFITCNEEGALSKYARRKRNCCVINLAYETYNQSYVVTSGYTNMYLAALAAFTLDNLEDTERKIEEISRACGSLLEKDYGYLENIVEEFDFDRVVYLGNNALYGCARESALKMIELSAGNVFPMYQSPLGLRHGPKLIMNPNTLVVLYLSDDPYTRKYETDLLKGLLSKRQGTRVLTVSSYPDKEAEMLSDYFYSFGHEIRMDNVFLGMDFVMIGQMIALYQSLKHNITSDYPCPTERENVFVEDERLKDGERAVLFPDSDAVMYGYEK